MKKTRRAIGDNRALRWIGLILLAGAIFFLAVNLPTLVGRRSEQAEVLGRFSLRYFAFLTGYLVLVAFLAGIAGLLFRRMLPGADKALKTPWWLIGSAFAPVLPLWAGWIFFRDFYLQLIDATVARNIGLALALWSFSLPFLVADASALASGWKGFVKKAGKVRAGLVKTAGRIPDLLVAPRFNALDGVFIALCVILAILLHIGYWRNIDSFVFLTGDAANISSFAAGRAHPELFAKDGVLGDLNNYRVYLTVHIPLIQGLGALFGNYGQPWAYLLAPHFIIQALGFYWLGWTLFRNRYWAALFSLTALAPFQMNLSEIWGIATDAIPRITFQALLPFVLALAILWRGKPQRWPWLMGLAGLLVYVHPVSTPAWGVAIWLGLLTGLPRDWTPARKLAWMALAGLAFAAVITPFAIHYLTTYSHGEVSNYQQVMQVMEATYSAGYLNPIAAIRDFAVLLVTEFAPLTLLAVLGSILAVLIPGGKENREKFQLLLIWLGGILAISTVVPLADHGYAAQTNGLPVEIDLIRGLRYVFPLLMGIAFWGLSGIPARLKARAPLSRFNFRTAAMALGLAFCCFWLIRYPVRPIVRTIDCWDSGNRFCPLNQQQLDTIDILKNIRENTEPGAALLTTSKSLEIRFFSLRAVVYGGRDRSILGYTNPQGLLAWNENTDRFKTILAETDPAVKLEGLTAMARDLNADYLMIDWPVSPESLAANHLAGVYSNSTFSLIRILPPDGAP